MGRQIGRRGFGAAALALLATPALGQGASFPNRPLRLVVPFPAGGILDAVARGLADQMSSILGQRVVVDNRPGGGQNIGADAVAKAAPDGHTLLLCSIPVFTSNRILYPRAPYDPDRDLAPLALVAQTVETVLVPASLPARSVADLVAAARERPGVMNYASFGVGSTGHLAMELLQRQTGTRFEHVLFRGQADAFTALVAGDVHVMITAQGTALPFIEGGRMRALAVLHGERQASLPGVPTVAEAGFPDLLWDSFFLLATTAGTPQPVQERLADAVQRAGAAAEFRERYIVRPGLLPMMGGIAETRAAIATARERGDRIVRDLGIILD
jgi:tripartite-type tricarboxylate transporter receptor subunit TctC